MIMGSDWSVSLILDLEAAEKLAALDEDFEGGALHLGAVVDAQHLDRKQNY